MDKIDISMENFSFSNTTELDEQETFRHGCLSDKEILKRMKTGDIVIEPFDKKNLNTSSYDLRLGQYYYREQAPKGGLEVYNPFSKSHVQDVWGKQHFEAVPVKLFFEDKEFFKTYLYQLGIRAGYVPRQIDVKQVEHTFENIHPEDKVIFIFPKETILAHTQEFIGGRNTVTTMMKARSSLGRNFIEVCKCAGWGDVGYINRWTMEITNNSTYRIIPLVVGRRMAQMIFFDVGTIEGEDYTKAAYSKYQSSHDLEQTRISWTPSQMIPKMHLDGDIHQK